MIELFSQTAPPDSPASYYFTQGVLGFTVVVLAYVVIKLYSKTESQQKIIDEQRDLRLQDSKEVVRDVTSVMQSNTDNMRILTEKIEVGKRSI